MRRVRYLDFGAVSMIFSTQALRHHTEYLSLVERMVMRKHFFKTLLASFLLFFAVRCSYGQSTFGSIIGVITDQTGAAISKASIEVRNVYENQVLQLVSDEHGEFVALNLKPAKYEVAAKATGFTRTVLSNIQLNARQERRVNLQLQVQSNSQIVEVSADYASVNTENATISVSLNGTQVGELPLNYRGTTTSPLAAIQATPGVQQDNGGKISVGGVMPTSVQFTVDGISTDNVRHSGPLKNTYPSTESIAEFKVSSVDNNAEFAEVGDVTFSTKSGTNKFHGSGFDYLQNAALDATVLGSTSKPKKVANTFGGSLGGPLALPGFLGGKNNTFFFVDYEGSRLHQETAEQFLVPTDEERSGNLSALTFNYTPTGGTSTQLINPFASMTGNLVGYTNNTITTINPVAQKLLAYIPHTSPQYASDTVSNYRPNIATPIDTDGYDIRIDRTLSAKQQIFGRWSWKNIDSKTSNEFLPTSEVPEKNRSLTFSHNYIFSSHLLNEARFGFSYWNSDEKFPLEGAAVLNSVGITGLDLSQHPTDGGFPWLDFSNGDNFTAFGHAVAGATQSSTLQFSDNFSWILYHHTIKFGGDAHLLGYHEVEHFSNGDDFGQFTFQQAGFTGNAYGDFLLGLPYNTYNATTGPNLKAHSTHLGFFVQDEYQATNRFTVSFGLRWELHPPFWEENGNITNFDFARDGVIIPDHTLAPSVGFLNSINLCSTSKYYSSSIYTDSSYPCSSFETASQLGLGQGLGTNYYANFNPRLGAAYRPFADSKTVIRAGVGLFTAGGFGTRAQLLSGVHTANTESYNNFTGAGVTPGTSPLFDFPNAYSGSGYSSIGMAMFMCGVNPHLRDPINAQWNLTLERELRSSTVARLSYIGMNSYRLENMEDINQVKPGLAPFSSANRPWTNWDMVHMLGNNAGANYQAAQAEINHRSHDGLTLQAGYTFAKNLTNAEGTAQLIPGFPYEAGATYTNKYDHRGDRGNDFATRRHRLLVTGLYELPVGRGKLLLKNSNHIVDALLGGWQLSTISLFQTGPFQTPIEAITDDPANIGVEAPVAGCHETATRPDRIGNANISNHTPSKWYDIDALKRVYGYYLPDGSVNPNDTGRDGNASVGSLVGPGTIAVAAGLSKEHSLGEGKKLHFEATFSNLPNHINWAPPAIDVSNPSTFGQTTSTQSAENAGNRTGQVALRFEF